jgi:hypothetical protein
MSSYDVMDVFADGHGLLERLGAPQSQREPVNVG